MAGPFLDPSCLTTAFLPAQGNASFQIHVPLLIWTATAIRNPKRCNAKDAS
jgi:hypothetical protein